jgi:orotidine-5'-phosphate decarboxylase
MDTLNDKIREMNNVVCLGLDPTLQGKACIPQFIVNAHEGDADGAILEFNQRILEAVGDLVPVVKPQFSFYVANDALHALKETIAAAKKAGILTILDAKMNDIGNTSEAYAKAAFLTLGADAVTVNGYLGWDCIEPFFACKGRGIFVLVKTSNQSSVDFQDLFTVAVPDVDPKAMSLTIDAGSPLPGDVGSITLERNFVRMGRLVLDWNAKVREEGDMFGAAGAVVGATYPDQLTYLRGLIPDVFFLIPGYGAQGATAADIRGGFTPEGTGAVVNSSRGLLYAYQLSKTNQRPPEEFEQATRAELEQMNAEIKAALAAGND